jgi:HK97 family phage major capsid protein
VENDLVTPTAITFEAVDLKARTLVALVQCSIELFEDSAVINEVMRNSLSKALGQQLDAAILRGTGTAVPLGIRNTTNVTVTPAAAGAGAVISRELISNACQTIWSANGTPNAVIMSPREYGILDRSVDSLTQPLKPFPSYDSLTKLFTSAIPVNLDSLATPATQTTSECYVGDFSEVIVGMRTNFTVEATRGFAGAFDHLQVAVRLYGRFDVAVSHPQHFVVISNLKAS